VNRKGITLLEVLMAIFIMGIGMVSVFAIFPVAALMMGQAIEKYQINEVVNNTQSNFDTDALEFVKNQPYWIYNSSGVQLTTINGSFLNSTNLTSSSTQYLFLDQAAGLSGVRPFLANNLAGVPGITVAYLSAGGTTSNIFNERFFTSNYDIELDESGRAVTPVSSAGKYSVSFLLEKKTPLDNPLPSRRYMLVYKGRSQTFADFSSSGASFSTNNAITVSNSFADICKKNDWVMVVSRNNINITEFERTFHQIRNINNATELELYQKFNPSIISGAATIQGVFLLSDVIRIIDMGAG
jgi:prepilin-type N-terminal cleavage/methylation domain-containing protein